jgi:hypothetical protein
MIVQHYCSSLFHLKSFYYDKILFEFILKLKFKITEMNSDEEMTKIKVVDLDDFYNFYIHDFFS